MPGKGTKRSPLDYALGVVARRRVSSGQLIDYMRRKGYPAEDIEVVLGKITEWGYLDDANYARDILQSMLAECPLGKRRARFELSKRLFEAHVTEDAIADVFGDAEESELASLAATKYLNGKDSGSMTERERERLARWLQRRGFGTESILSALRNIAVEDRE